MAINLEDEALRKKVWLPKRGNLFKGGGDHTTLQTMSVLQTTDIEHDQENITFF